MKSTSDVPIFLRKTYHMIDTCDPTIASWSEDGKTFIVKQPDLFSSKVIPQFFKHSKFSSFVRQLNFYGFKKIKYSDNIKIDEKLEKETKDYWRFRHDCFCKGREDLLIEIKRSHSTQKNIKKPEVSGEVKVTVPSSESKTEVNELKQELDTLKDKIAKMTDNIDNLTSLVQNVKLEETKSQAEDEHVHAGAKRKKVDDNGPSLSTLSTQEQTTSAVQAELDDVIMSSSTDSINGNDDLETISFTPSSIFPTTTTALLRQDSQTSALSDEAFVDELFNALDNSDMEVLPEPVPTQILPEKIVLTSSPTSTMGDMPVTPESKQIIKQEGSMVPYIPNQNAPDPELMKKLSNALTILPKEMQELLVNRLIATITSSDALKSHLDSITASNDKSVSTTIQTNSVSLPETSLEANPEVVLPLAAATLTALMTQLSANIKNKPCVTNGKSLPVIPIHA